MSGYGNGKSTIADTVFSPASYISVSCLWTIVSIAFSYSWYVGGAVILMGPIYGLAVLIYQTAVKKRHILMPFAILAVAYSIYIMIMHAVHGELFVHGVSDILVSVFFITCLVSLDGKELKYTIEKVSHVLLWLTILYSAVSIIFNYIVTVDDLMAMEDGFFKNSFLRWLPTESHDNRMFGLSGNPNPSGSWVVYGLIFGMLYIVIKEKITVWDAILLIVAAAFVMVMLIGTESRDAILTLSIFGLMFVILYLSFIRRHIGIRSRRYLDLCVFIVITVALVVFFALMFSNDARKIIFGFMRIDYAEDMPFLDVLKNIAVSFKSATTRDILRKETMDIWQKNKLWGVSSQSIVDSYSYAYSKIPAQCGSHNTFIQILATTGVPGIVLHAMLWISSFIMAFCYAVRGKDSRLRAVSVYIFALMPAVLFNNLYENFLYTNIELMVLMGFFMFALSAQLGNMLSKEAEPVVE